MQGKQKKLPSILFYNFAISGVNVLLFTATNSKQTKKRNVELNFVSFCIEYQAFFIVQVQQK